MFFTYPVPVPADRAEADPFPVDAILCVGIVTEVSVQFPAGCSGMVFVTIWRGEHQVWPVNLDEAISGEEAIVSWPERYVMDEAEYVFQIRGWSPGTRYPHTVTVRFAIQPLPEAEGWPEEEPVPLSLADILG